MSLDGLYIEEFGDPERPNVVLVHGAADRSTTFRRVIDQLTEYRIVAYDRRGYGRSLGAQPATSMSEHADDLLAIMARSAAPCVVVAHSFGSNLTMLAVTQQPDRFAAVGLWEPPLVWTDIWPQRVRDYNAMVAASPDPAANIEALYRHLLGDGWERLSDEGRAERRAEGAAYQLDMACQLTAPFTIDDVVVPAVVGFGSATRASHIAGAQWLADNLPDATTFVIEGAAHFGCRTHPDEYAQFVRSAVAAAQ